MIGGRRRHSNCGGDVLVRVNFTCAKCGAEWGYTTDMVRDTYRTDSEGAGLRDGEGGVLPINTAHTVNAASVDMVNNPPHYKSNPSGVECIDIVEGMPFCQGNAIKYLWRAGLKGDAIEDIQKAIWYAKREITRLKKLKEGK